MPVRRLLLVLLLLLVGLLVAPAPASAGPRTDAEFVHRINASRTARGLPPLRVSARLTSLARSHAHAMAVNNCRAPRGCLWHTNISRSVDHWAWLGQNVGYIGYGRFDGDWRNWVLRLHRAFMASPPPTGPTSCTGGPTGSASAPSGTEGGSGWRSTSCRRRPAEAGRQESFDRAPMAMAPSARSVVGR